MGYYSEFTIAVDEPVDYDELESLIEELEAKSGYTFEGYRNYITLSSAKWYDWAEHIEELSAAHPEHEFTIEIDGEERGDHTKVTYKNGVVIRSYKLIWVPADN